MQVLDHVGIAVADLDNAITLYVERFGFSLDVREEIPEHHVRVAFIRLENTWLELLSPIGSEGPLAKFLAERGPGLHHVCYRVKDIESELSRLCADGFKLIDSKPRQGSRGTKVAFIHPKSVGGVLTELCEYI